MLLVGGGTSDPNSRCDTVYVPSIKSCKLVFRLLVPGNSLFKIVLVA